MMSVLVEYYGFMEEPDFIINDDIKTAWGMN